MHDLSALYVKTGDATIFPNEVYNDPEFDTAYIRTKFHPAIYDHIVWNPENKHIVKFDEERNKVLKPAWLAAIKKYPGTYLANRWETFLYFLRIRNYSGITYYNPWIADNEFGYSINGNRPSYKLYTKLMDKQKNAFYFNIWFWGLVNIILFAGVRMIRDSAHKFIYTCILLSGILYLLPYYLLITVDTDFRYVYWMCLCCIMAIIYLLLIRRQQQLLNNNTISTQQPGKPHG